MASHGPGSTWVAPRGQPWTRQVAAEKLRGCAPTVPGCPPLVFVWARRTTRLPFRHWNSTKPRSRNELPEDGLLRSNVQPVCWNLLKADPACTHGDRARPPSACQPLELWNCAVKRMNICSCVPSPGICPRMPRRGCDDLQTLIVAHRLREDWLALGLPDATEAATAIMAATAVATSAARRRECASLKSISGGVHECSKSCGRSHSMRRWRKPPVGFS